MEQNDKEGSHTSKFKVERSNVFGDFENKSEGQRYEASKPRKVVKVLVNQRKSLNYSS